MRGAEPCPAVPVATSRTRAGSFSAVPMLTRVTRAAVDGRAAAFGHREFGVDLGEVLADHEVDADAGHVGFFTRFGEEDHVAIELARPGASASAWSMRLAASTGLSSLLPRPQM